MTTLLVIAAITLAIGVLAMFYEMRKLANRQETPDATENEKLREYLVRMEASVEALQKNQQANLQGLQQQMQTSSNQMSERLNKAAVELAKVQEHTASMKELQDILKSPKLRGNVGEDMMKDILTQCLPKANFKLQYGFKSGEKVDAVIMTKSGLIPVDSKFPLENYLSAQKAEGKEKEAQLKEFHKQVKKHIDEIGKKYIQPAENTVDFAFMYVPGEPLFYEIYNNTELVNYGAERKVMLVSPNSFVYLLKIVLVGLEGEQAEESAKRVLRELQAIQQDSSKLGSEIGVLNRHVKNAGVQIDKVNNSYVRLGTKIENAGHLQEGAVEDTAKLGTNELLEDTADEVAEDRNPTLDLPR